MVEFIPSVKHLPYGGAHAIQNPVHLKYISNYISTKLASELENSMGLSFIMHYRQWVSGSNLNNFRGLMLYDDFMYESLCNGTTEAFDKWYLLNHGKRLRIFRGEYMYHGAVFTNLGLPFAYLDDEPLAKNDFIVISMPFADTGNVHDKMIEVLDQAAEMGVKALIDCAYVGLTQNIEFDFGHPAIHTVTFSLSKSFPIAHARIGIRISRFDHDDGLDIYAKTNYANQIALCIGQELVTKFDIDETVLQYRNMQRDACKLMGITPSNTVIFGLGGDKWKIYNRGTSTNRLFLGGIYEKSK